MAAQAYSSFSLKSCLQSVLCSPWSLSFCPTQLPQNIDVAIIGAGLAGLTAANALQAAGKSVLVLEARNEVGGKVQNRALNNGGVAETGAEFVGPTQDKILGLIEELGLETFDTYDEGRYILWRRGNRKVYGKTKWLGIDNLPPVSWVSLLQLGVIQFRLDTWAAQINVSAPWSHAKAAEWDGQTVEQWLSRWAWFADAKFMMHCLTRGLWGVEPRELSLLSLLGYIAGAGNETVTGRLDRLLDVGGGAQEKRVVGGTGLIPLRLAERVGYENIVLGARVVKVVKREDAYTVVWEHGNVTANKVVVAVGPTLMRSIEFEPQLPESRRNLNEGLQTGSMGKAIAVYDKPFWRTEDGLNGQAFVDLGTISQTYDNSPEDASYGAIMGFFQGDMMRRVDSLSPSEVKKEVLADFVRYFGQKAANTTDFVLQRWGLEEHLWGGPTAVGPPEVLSKYGDAMTRSVDGIHFAGTETSGYWPGYMDGAVRSGLRVAGEVLVCWNPSRFQKLPCDAPRNAADAVTCIDRIGRVGGIMEGWAGKERRVKRKKLQAGDGWTVIAGSGKAKESNEAEQLRNARPTKTVPGLTVEKLSADFRDMEAKWRKSACAKNIDRMLSLKDWSATEAVCIGVGSFSLDWEHRYRSMWQLVLFLAVVKLLRSDDRGTALYAQEPAFTPLDVSFLSTLDIGVLPTSIGTHITLSSFVFAPFVDWYILLPLFLRDNNPQLYIGNEILGDYGVFANTQEKESVLKECNDLGKIFVKVRERRRVPEFEGHGSALEGLMMYWKEEEDEDEDD